MGRAMQLQEQQMMQEREREYNQALDQCMDQDRLQVSCCCSCLMALAAWHDVLLSSVAP